MPLVAFALDDAPNSITEDLIDVFYDNGVHATFFIVGQQVNSAYAKTLNNAIGAGMELGAHSFAHQNPVQNYYDEYMALDDYKACFEAIKMLRAAMRLLLRVCLILLQMMRYILF